jgi:hypothetical protein
MADNDDIQQVSMANTKKEMLQAYTELKKLLTQRERELFDAKKMREQDRRRATEAAATEAVATDPVERIAELEKDLAGELRDLATRFSAERDRYRALCEEIENKQADLARVFEVETAAVDLAALLQAQKAQEEEFASQMAREKAEHEATMAARKAEWKDEAARYEQQRKREREEHTYEWKRELARKKTELQDELAELTSQIQSRQAEFDAQVEARERSLTEREEAVAERERVLDDLQARVDAFPDERDAAVSRAVEETRARLESEHDLARKLLTKEFEGQIHVLESRIASLTDLVAQQAQQIEASAQQQSRAYEQVQDIASKAVAGATRTIITGAGGERGDGRRRDEERE